MGVHTTPGVICTPSRARDPRGHLHYTRRFGEIHYTDICYNGLDFDGDQEINHMYKIVCHQCNSILPPGSTHCPHCGNTITDSDIATQAAASQNPLYLLPGTTLQDGRYVINSVIGQGGFGITYDGTDLRLDRHVAIKEYFPNPMANRNRTLSNNVSCSSYTMSLYDQGLNNFLKEAKNMARFAGEDNFVSVYDYFAENNTAYIIMDYVEGQNLKQYLSRRGRLSIEETMAIAMPVMSALEKIHMRGMIHRDVSPSNIMILPDGRVRLLDFGAARDIDLERKHMTTMSSVYKDGYSPIEQQTRDMPQGAFSDIYALCATMYEMLTGNTPPSPFIRIRDDTLVLPSELGVRLTTNQEYTLLRGLAVYGDQRIQTIGELRDGLLGTGMPSSGQNTEAPRSNRTLLLAILGAAIVILLVSVGYILFQTSGGKPDLQTDSNSVAAVEEETPQTEETVQESLLEMYGDFAEFNKNGIFVINSQYFGTSKDELKELFGETYTENLADWEYADKPIEYVDVECNGKGVCLYFEKDRLVAVCLAANETKVDKPDFIHSKAKAAETIYGSPEKYKTNNGLYDAYRWKLDDDRCRFEMFVSKFDDHFHVQQMYVSDTYSGSYINVDSVG